MGSQAALDFLQTVGDDAGDEAEGQEIATIQFAQEVLGWTETLAIMVAGENDEDWYNQTPAQRWARMLRWTRDALAQGQVRGAITPCQQQ